MTEISSYAGVGTATSSKYLISSTRKGKNPIEYRLFWNEKHSQERNLDPSSFDPAEVDAVILARAHIDHCCSWLAKSFAF